MSRPLLLALGASLAANLFLVGVVAGGWFGAREEPRDSVPAELERSMSPERIAAMRDYFQANRDERREGRRARRAMWAEAREAMIAEPYDREALEAVLMRLAESSDERRRRRYLRLASFMETMSVEERTAFADAMRARYQRRREARERRGG